MGVPPPPGNQVSTDRLAQATKTGSKTCADVRTVQVSLPDIFNSKSASAVGNVSSEAQTFLRK